MSSPPGHNQMTTPSYGVYNGVLLPPIPSNLRATPPQYAQPAGVLVTRQVYHPPYYERSAPGQAPRAPNNQQLLGSQGGNGQVPGPYAVYQYRQWGYAQSSSRAVGQGYGSQQYGFQEVHHTGQAHAGQSSMPATIRIQQARQHSYQAVQQQHVHLQYNYDPSTSNGTAGRILSQQHPYQGVKQQHVHTQYNYDPTPSNGIVARIPSLQQANNLPRGPQSRSTSRPFIGSNIPDFLHPNTNSVFSASKSHQSTEPVKSGPSSTIFKDVPASRSSVGTVQATNPSRNAEQVVSVSTVQQQPSLQVVKEQVAAAKKRLDDVLTRKNHSLQSKPENAKIQAELLSSDSVYPSMSKTIPSIKPPSPPKSQALPTQLSKENIEQRLKPSTPKFGAGTTRSALCHQPDLKINIEAQNRGRATTNESCPSMIHDEIAGSRSVRAGANIKMDHAPATSQPPTALANTESGSTEKPKDSKGPVQPTVIFLQPGKVVVEARKISGSAQPAMLDRKSTPTNRVVGQTGLQQSGQQGSLGLKYLDSVSSDEHVDQKSRSSKESASRQILTAYRKGDLIRPEPAPNITSGLSTALFTVELPSQRRPTSKSRSPQDEEPSLKIKSSPAAPRETHRPMARIISDIDAGPENCPTGTSRFEYDPDDPDLEDFFAATSNAKTPLNHLDDPDLQDVLVANSQPKMKRVDVEASQPSNESSSLGRFFVHLPSVCLLVSLLT
ncbi:hypothetical protein BKA64DRAFT_108997 [Cadophora sp. MPI-SDFR-AT-0126]|nr:hypothetical protein BKA64DRAFT_108997 [Leotiomycetes sp. MPI-SDFR-AT-0126]